MLSRTPVKFTLALLYLLLLTACGGAAEQPAAPPVATRTPLPVAATATLTGPPASPTPEPSPQLAFAEGMTAVQQQRAQAFFDDHLRSQADLPAAVHLQAVVAADGRTILYADPPGHDDLARAYGLNGDGNPTQTILLESP